MIQLVLAGDTLSGVLGLTLKRKGLASVEVNLGVDTGSLLGLVALSELLGYCRCFCCKSKGKARELDDGIKLRRLHLHDIFLFLSYGRKLLRRPSSCAYLFSAFVFQPFG